MTVRTVPFRVLPQAEEQALENADMCVIFISDSNAAVYTG